jgi:hypothetical protein
MPSTAQLMALLISAVKAALVSLLHLDESLSHQKVDKDVPLG